MLCLEHTILLQKTSFPHFTIVAKDCLFWLNIVTPSQLICDVTQTWGTSIVMSYSSIVLACANWHKWVPGCMILVSLICMMEFCKARKVILILKWIPNCMIVLSHNIQYWWSHQWILVVSKHRETSLYNMVNYNTILIYHDIDNGKICITLWTEKGNPLLHRIRWTMVYIFCEYFWGKHCVIMGIDFIII